jgi:hypothetical protein
MNGEPKHAATDQKLQPRQFSLAGMLGFMVLCSLYCAQFTVLREWLREQRGNFGPAPPVAVATWLAAWAVFGLFYWRLRATLPLALHCYWPVIVLGFGLVCRTAGLDLGTAAFIFFIASALSFPFCVLWLAKHFARPKLRHDQPSAMPENVGESAADAPASHRESRRIENAGEPLVGTLRVSVGSDSPRTPVSPTEDGRTAPQFSLSGLLGFVLLCSLYCAQFAVLRGWGDFGPASVLAAATWLAAWGVFGLFYWRLRATAALAVHCYWPALMLWLGLVFVSAGIGIGALAFALFVSSAISFPICVWTLARRAFWPEPQREQTRHPPDTIGPA